MAPISGTSVGAVRQNATARLLRMCTGGRHVTRASQPVQGRESTPGTEPFVRHSLEVRTRARSRTHRRYSARATSGGGIAKSSRLVANLQHFCQSVLNDAAAGGGYGPDVR